jgi:hypothetical protein
MPFPVCRAERFGHTARRTETSAPASPSNLASVSVERVSPGCPLQVRFLAPVSCHSGCSVLGFSSKRIFPPLTVARSHSAPLLHGHYPLLRSYGLSDSRKKQKKHAGLPGSSTHLSPRAAPSHPGEPDGCFTCYLDHRCQASSAPTDWPLPNSNEAESGSLALRLAGLPCKAS